MAAVIHSFSYDPKEHPELHRFLSEAAKEHGGKSAKIVELLERGLGVEQKVVIKTSNEGIDNIIAMLGRIEARLESVHFSESAKGEKLPDDVAAAIAALDF